MDIRYSRVAKFKHVIAKVSTKIDYFIYYISFLATNIILEIVALTL